MKCKKTAILATIVFSIAISGCGTSSSSSTTGYDVNLTDTISQLSTIPPLAESFTLNAALTPPYDTALVSGALTKRQYVTVVLKNSASSLGFALGEYNSDGKLLYKMVSIFTITSADILSTATTANKWMLPTTDKPVITYTLSGGTSTLLVTGKAGLAPKRYTATGAALTAVITQTAPAVETEPKKAATYSVTFSAPLSPAFSGAACTITDITLATGTSI